MAQGQMLNFISNHDLNRFTKDMVEAAQKAKERVEADPYRSVVDPFSALFDAAVQDISLDEWMLKEQSRQIQKALQNKVGYFHQCVIGAMPGWESTGPYGGGYDVVNRDKKIIAEIKNKYNTTNSGSSNNLYNTLAGHLDFGMRGYTAYFVAVITKGKSRFDKPFVPSRRTAKREDLRVIDGRSFYDMAAGEDGALRKLYEVLPAVLEGILGKPIRGNGAKEIISSAVQDAPISSAYEWNTDFIALFQRAFQ